MSSWLVIGMQETDIFAVLHSNYVDRNVSSIPASRSIICVGYLCVKSVPDASAIYLRCALLAHALGKHNLQTPAKYVTTLQGGRDLGQTFRARNYRTWLSIRAIVRAEPNKLSRGGDLGFSLLSEQPDESTVFVLAIEAAQLRD